MVPRKSGPSETQQRFNWKPWRASDCSLRVIPRVKPEGMLFGKPLRIFPDHVLAAGDAQFVPLVGRVKGRGGFPRAVPNRRIERLGADRYGRDQERWRLPSGN